MKKKIRSSHRLKSHDVHCESCNTSNIHTDRGRYWLELIGMLVFVVVLWKIFSRLGILTLNPNAQDIVGLGAIFIIGLVAASSSCLALVGGLLLSVSASWSQAHIHESKWKKLKPFLLFNGGRLIGYFVLGGLVGFVGSTLNVSSYATGLLTLALAIIMLMLGLRLLRILPKQYCTLPLPRAWLTQLSALSGSRNPLAPLLLGTLTFFIPCGFTQSVQLLALSSGSFLNGGLIMLTFALGTLPTLLGISVVSSLVEGNARRWFMLFSGTLVVLLAILNIQGGLRLIGIDAQSFLERAAAVFVPTQGQTNDPYVSIDEQGRQIISMYISDDGYEPDSFVIEAERPTWVYAIAREGVSGCGRFLLAPTFNMSTQINQGDNWLGPLPEPKNDFLLTCSMGMFRAVVRVQPAR